MTTRAELSKIDAAQPDHTDLMRAALDGETEKVRDLLARGVDVNEADNEGRTALMFAVINMHNEAARELLRHGADINATSADGGTALILAVTAGNTEIVRELLTRGANLSAAYTESGKNSLTLANEKGHAEIIQLLEAAGTKD